MNSFIRSSFAVMLTSCTLAALAQSSAQPAAKPTVTVGDRWSWQHTNGLSNEKDYTVIETVVEVNPAEIRTQAKIKGKSGNGVATYTTEWNPVDVATAKYDPFLKLIEFPLQVGKKWKASADKMLFSNGKHGSFHLNGEVVALEKITVPAGTFDAYKIKVVLEGVGTDEDANIGNTIETRWYAPAANQFVRTENEFSRDGRVRQKDINELLEYSLR